VVRIKNFRKKRAQVVFNCGWFCSIGLFGLLLGLSTEAQNKATDWQTEVRKYADARDWESALRLVDQNILLAPEDMDVRGWRARVLAWSGRLAEAEQEYMRILSVSRNDVDTLMALSAIYAREGRFADARRSIDTAEQLDPRRADVHVAHGRMLRAAGHRSESQLEFQKALQLDPSSAESREGLIALRNGPKHEIRLGQDNDVFNFTGANHDESISVASQWNSDWSTSVAAYFYQRGDVGAGKFTGSVTRRQATWGAATMGGALGHANGVIPRYEVFFDLDHGWKTTETNFIRAVEIEYGQHWYWYQASRILTLTGTAIIYLPREWLFTLSTTGVRSAFLGSGVEWKPSGLTRLGFPLRRWSEKRLSGSIFFAAGTENFAQVDQIGRFASQTYGGGLRLQITNRQDIGGSVAYQKRTQKRTEMSMGLSYGIHF
jgi:tetratricopeptide (TPR) repeat protein